jgi:hypothetical protein
VALLGLLILSGCNGSGGKTVVSVQMRSGETGPAVNRYKAASSRPTVTPTRPTPTPVLAEQEDVEVTPTAARPGAGLVPTPTPLAIPILVGPPQRIVIPPIDLDVSIEAVEPATSRFGNQWFRDWRTASHAAGYHAGSAMLGQLGNTVISGHNNIEGSVFKDLYHLERGDPIYLYADGFRYDYVVMDRFVLREQGMTFEQRLQNASWIHRTLDERVTLVSCWPPEGNAYRVIVIAQPAGDDTQTADSQPVPPNS